MNDELFDFWQQLPVISQEKIDWLLAHDVPPLALGSGNNPPLKRSDAGIVILIEDEAGAIDCATWSLQNGGEITLLTCAAFALGEEQISNPGAYSFDGSLRIHETPLQWLQADRSGIVVVDWRKAFDRLRHVPKLTVPESLLRTYRQAMKPAGPQVLVATERLAA